MTEQQERDLQADLKFEEFLEKGILEAIVNERLYQDRKYGTPERRHLSVGTYLLIMRKELEEAISAMIQGDQNGAMSELLQVVAVGVAAMERHGVQERPDVGRKVFY